MPNMLYVLHREKGGWLDPWIREQTHRKWGYGVGDAWMGGWTSG